MCRTFISERRSCNFWTKKELAEVIYCKNEREVASFPLMTNSKIASTELPLFIPSGDSIMILAGSLLRRWSTRFLNQKNPIPASGFTSKRLNDELFTMLRINSRSQIGGRDDEERARASGGGRFHSCALPYTYIVTRATKPASPVDKSSVK